MPKSKYEVLKESVVGLVWKLLPLSVRNSLSEKITQAQKRARIHIPLSNTRVYTTTERTKELFNSADIADFSSGYEGAGKAADITRFSLVATCLNEKSGIVRWLESVASQSLIPDEVVLCDGGSTDGTLEIVEQWYEDYADRISEGSRFELTFLRKHGVNIAVGRNLAIEAASNEIIALTDVGCELERRWSEYLMLPFMDRPETEVVMGWYEAVCRNRFSTALARFIVPRIELIDPSVFIPSARSVALRRSLWARVDGYPEYLTLAGEDSLFDYYLKQHAKHWAFVPDALVFWEFPKTVRHGFRTIYNYSKGDAEGGVLSWSHYLWVLTSLAAVCISLVCFLFLLLISVSLSNLLCFLLSLPFAMMAGYEVSRLTAPYQPFVDVERRSDMFFRALALVIVILGQGLGFMKGLMNRRLIELRRLSSASKGHVFVLTDEQLSFGNGDSDSFSLLEELLQNGWFITNVHVNSNELTLNPIEDRLHPRKEAYLLRLFDLREWRHNYRGYIASMSGESKCLLMSESKEMGDLALELAEFGVLSYELT